MYNRIKITYPKIILSTKYYSLDSLRREILLERIVRYNFQLLILSTLDLNRVLNNFLLKNVASERNKGTKQGKPCGF